MEEKALRVGLIGCGAVGQDIVHLVAERAASDIVFAGVLVRHPARTWPPGNPKVVSTLAALLAEMPDVVVEVAGHEGLREHGPAVLRAGIDLFFISVGALAESDLIRELSEAARMGGAQARVVAGAIGALDALAAASLGDLTRVTHTMRKPPQTLLAAEEAAHLSAAREIFHGNVREAVAQFPEFLNVAAAVALAGNGLDQTEVRVIADPTIEHSRHEVQAEGTFGFFHFSIENAPIVAYGRGARLVAMSVVHALLLRRALLLIG